MENIIAGDTYTFSVSSLDYTDDGYSGKCSFVNADSGYSYTTTTYTDGDWVFTIPSTITSGYTSGLYTKLVFAVSDTERHTISTGMLKILPDPLTTPTDLRSNARKIVEAIDAELAGSASPSQQSITIGGKAISRYSIPDLMKLRSTYVELARIEEKEDGLSKSTGSMVRVRFQ